MKTTGVKRRSGIYNSAEIKEKIKIATIFPELEDNRKDEEEIDIQGLENRAPQDFGIELKKGANNKEYIMSLFTHPLYAELFFAWCKDCSENITVENAKFFRDELLLRKNKDMRSFHFKAMRVAKNFLIAFVGNLESGKINKLNLADNLVTDVCMHTIKSIISAKKLHYLNLASNMISTEGLKIFQNEVMNSDSLNYLNVMYYLCSLEFILGASEGITLQEKEV